jgi:D-alanine-D-alanine ligase
MQIVVIAGGTSSEREVSLRSGAAVAAALTQAGHQADIVDPTEQAITPELARRYDVAFPIIHGRGGEDGSLQQQLDTIGLPYVGSGVEACQLTFDKATYKRLLATHGLAIPAGAIASEDDIIDQELINQPFVLKPFDGGSSVDTFIVRDPKQADWQAIRDALARYDAMLLESLIMGTEITVGVLDDQALPVIEIIPPENGEFDYENKYNGATQELCPPKHLDEMMQRQAQDLAVKIHQLCGCAGFSRTDMIVTDDNQLVVLETNTLPGMTNESLFPKAARVAGLSMPTLCDQLVRLAFTRQTDAV